MSSFLILELLLIKSDVCLSCLWRRQLHFMEE